MFSAGIEPAGMIVHNIELLKRAKQNNFIINFKLKNCLRKQHFANDLHYNEKQDFYIRWLTDNLILRGYIMKYLLLQAIDLSHQESASNLVVGFGIFL